MTSKMNRDKVKVSTVLLLFLLAIVLLVGRGKWQQYKLIHSHLETDGKITHINLNFGKNGTLTEYEYFVGGTRYVDGFPSKSICGKLSRNEKMNLLGKKILVIYEPSSPNINSAIISQNIIDIYNVQLSDSMKTFIQQSFDCD